MGLTIGDLYLRRSAWINETPDIVWREFETMERFSAWFGTGHEVELYQPHLHGRIELSVDIDDERIGFGGNILVFEPAAELSHPLSQRRSRHCATKSQGFHRTVAV